jgi:hypothetical protein
LKTINRIFTTKRKDGSSRIKAWIDSHCKLCGRFIRKTTRLYCDKCRRKAKSNNDVEHNRERYRTDPEYREYRLKKNRESKLKRVVLE